MGLDLAGQLLMRVVPIAILLHASGYIGIGACVLGGLWAAGMTWWVAIDPKDESAHW